MTIKKSYIEIVEFLQANANKKVSTLMAEILLLAESKKASKTFIEDKEGNVLAIYCYYHKQWEILANVAYGSKANSSTGFNTMCKIGTAMWTKKQRDAKTAKSDLLDDVACGNVTPSLITDMMADIETKRLTIDTTNMPIGYTNEDDVWEVMLNPKDFAIE